jgi:hypothetical protein
VPGLVIGVKHKSFVEGLRDLTGIAPGIKKYIIG